MSKCLVTGGCGFIGSNLVDALIDRGDEVIVIDNKSADNENFYENKFATYFYEDIIDYKNTRKYYDEVDYVFHLAAESRIGPAIENPIAAAQKNCIGTCTVLQCSREAKVKKVIYSSTSSGYGNNPYPNVETQPDDCLNPYSVTKVSGEKFCKLYNDLFGLKTVVFRYFNVYGPRAPKRGQYAPVIGIFARQSAAGENLTIVGDGEQRRDFIHVFDVVRANIIVATSEVDDDYYGQVYNVGSGKNYSVNQIADWISEKQVYLPKREGEVNISLANIDKIQKVFGWKPENDLESWIKENV